MNRRLHVLISILLIAFFILILRPNNPFSALNSFSNPSYEDYVMQKMTDEWLYIYNKKLPEIERFNEYQADAMFYNKLGHRAVPVVGGIKSGSEYVSRTGVGFRAPRKMDISESAIVKLVMDQQDVIAEIFATLSQEDHIHMMRVEVSNTMIAELVGTHFDIRTLGNDLQAISDISKTEWSWEVTPKAAGNHKLHLSLMALVNIDGEKIPRVVGRHYQVIAVDRPFVEDIKAGIGPYFEVYTALSVIFGAVYGFFVLIKKLFVRNKAS